ncbi:MAG: hypothetical protein KDD52_04750 [Bdellovibrionales bacterium]|nr:hypothetical protein [Bdellovibrionales bacterium]
MLGRQCKIQYLALFWGFVGACIFVGSWNLAHADIPTVVTTNPWTTQTGGQYNVHGAYETGVGGWNQTNYDPNYAAMYQNPMSNGNNIYRLYQGFTVARDAFWLFTSNQGSLGQRLGYLVADRATQYYDRNLKPVVDAKVAMIEAQAQQRAAQMMGMGNCPQDGYLFAQNQQGIDVRVLGGQIQGSAVPNPIPTQAFQNPSDVILGGSAGTSVGGRR